MWKMIGYHCPHCNSVITNEACVVWKKTDSREVVSKPHHNVCDKVVEIRFDVEGR